ncbi:hypothetical protein [Noviherbaspirillum humi]|uniref:hypothetical protein n=1 Tax=Noviherbaspirillum humi TaxID=1688639 RepID=UPI000B788724|nr:hypothetical protein [Noviherbaspirillum humi]
MASILQDVVDTAARAVETFSDRTEGNLDFSESSLSIIEELLEEASAYVTEMPESRVTDLIQLFGCYVLEVARKNYGGDYAWLDDNRGPVLVVGEPATHIAISTWAKVRGRLNGDRADDIPFFYKGFSNMARERPTARRILFI